MAAEIVKRKCRRIGLLSGGTDMSQVQYEKLPDDVKAVAALEGLGVATEQILDETNMLTTAKMLIEKTLSETFPKPIVWGVNMVTRSIGDVVAKGSLRFLDTLDTADITTLSEALNSMKITKASF